MQNTFVADDFLRMMILTLQKETGYALKRGGLYLQCMDFSALRIVEAVALAPDGIERFSSLMEKKAEDSIHDRNRSIVSTTLIVVPIVKNEDGTASFMPIID